MSVLVGLVSATALAQPVGEPTRGVVQSLDGAVLTLVGGAPYTLIDDVRVTLVTAATAADLTPGHYVAITAVRGVDGTLLASVVSTFPEALRGTGEGQRPLSGENLMTNATIDEAVLDAVDEGMLAVTFLGQTDRVRITAATRIELRSAGTLADIAPGATVSFVPVDGTVRSVSVLVN